MYHAVPEPNPSCPHSGASGLDTLALLVSIYGSTDLFIVEYRSLLADKLLTNTSYATDSEVANLELLKIRCVFTVVAINCFVCWSSARASQFFGLLLFAEGVVTR